MSPPLLSRRQAMTPQYCPEKVVKAFAISSERTAVNSWPCLDQWAGVGPHWAKMEPLNQLSRGRRHRKILPVALRVCGDSCVEVWGLETVAEIRHKSACVSLYCNVFTWNNLKSIPHFVFNMNKSPPNESMVHFRCPKKSFWNVTLERLHSSFQRNFSD